MKSNTIYIIILFIAVAVVILFVTSHKTKRFDERLTYRRQDKIPYGTYVAFHHLRDLFPQASIYTSRHEPGYWDSINVDEPGQAYIAVTDYFNADEYEMRKLISFVENGNDVFISARSFSDESARMITIGKLNSSMLTYIKPSPSYYADSLSVVSLFPDYASYTYPGKNLSTYFHTTNGHSDVLGTDEQGHPNFIRLRAGRGNFYVHLAPLAFSNYFLLHKNNIAYYEASFSIISPGVKRIVWDEYYLRKKTSDRPREPKKSWLTVFFQYPGFRAGLLVAFATLLIYVLTGMRRKQRIIPVISQPRNDSMDFVKTIGRLYYEKGDHRNLSRKMSAYFLDYVRSKYKLATGLLDEVFVRNLGYKSGVDEKQIRELVSLIKYTEDSPAISAQELMDFHKQLEAFYKKA